MALVYLGSLSTAQINPGLSLALASAVPRINAQLAAFAQAVASLNLTPPTIVANLGIAQSLVTTLQAQIALGIQVPTAAAQISVINGFIAALGIELGALGFDLGAAGIHAYAYDGVASALGPAIPANLPGGAPTDHVNALLLATSVPASWLALAGILKVS